MDFIGLLLGLMDDNTVQKIMQKLEQTDMNNNGQDQITEEPEPPLLMANLICFLSWYRFSIMKASQGFLLLMQSTRAKRRKATCSRTHTRVIAAGQQWSWRLGYVSVSRNLVMVSQNQCLKSLEPQLTRKGKMRSICLELKAKRAMLVRTEMKLMAKRMFLQKPMPTNTLGRGLRKTLLSLKESCHYSRQCAPRMKRGASGKLMESMMRQPQLVTTSRQSSKDWYSGLARYRVSAASRDSSRRGLGCRRMGRRVSRVTLRRASMRKRQVNCSRSMVMSRRTKAMQNMSRQVIANQKLEYFRMRLFSKSFTEECSSCWDVRLAIGRHSLSSIRLSTTECSRAGSSAQQVVESKTAPGQVRCARDSMCSSLWSWSMRPRTFMDSARNRTVRTTSGLSCRVVIKARANLVCRGVYLSASPLTRLVRTAVWLEDSICPCTSAQYWLWPSWWVNRSHFSSFSVSLQKCSPKNRTAKPQSASKGLSLTLYPQDQVSSDAHIPRAAGIISILFSLPRNLKQLQTSLPKRASLSLAQACASSSRSGRATSSTSLSRSALNQTHYSSFEYFILSFSQGLKIAATSLSSVNLWAQVSRKGESSSCALILGLSSRASRNRYSRRKGSSLQLTSSSCSWVRVSRLHQLFLGLRILSVSAIQMQCSTLTRKTFLPSNSPIGLTLISPANSSVSKAPANSLVASTAKSQSSSRQAIKL